MSDVSLPKETIIKLYQDGESTRSIAKKYNTYPTKIVRLLHANGIVLRNKSEAQSNALAIGSAKHPMKGKKHSNQTKIRISEGRYKSWQALSPEKRQEVVDSARERWNTLGEAKKNEIRDMAADAVRRAAKHGSQIEIFLKRYLVQHGYDVVFHKKGLIENENLEVDIYIPLLNVAIEIDGPTHFLPIWGEEKLLKHIKADSEKSALLMGSGIRIIRVKYLLKFSSDKSKRDISAKILEVLNKIKSGRTNENMYTEIEV